MSEQVVLDGQTRIHNLMSEADLEAIGVRRSIVVDGMRTAVDTGDYHVQPMFQFKDDAPLYQCDPAYMRADLPMSEYELDLWVRDGELPDGHVAVSM